VLAGIRVRRRGQATATEAKSDDHGDALAAPTPGQPWADEGVDARAAFGAPEPTAPIPAAAAAALSAGGACRASRGSAAVANWPP